MYKVLSASGGEQADKCPGSFALDFDKAPDNFFAARGTYIHRYLELANYSEQDAEMFRLTTNSEYNRCLAAAIDTESLFADLNNLVVDGRIFTEQKFWFDGNDTKLLRKTHKSRDYPDNEGFGGTTDWLKAGIDRVAVVDYKTGIEKDPLCAQMKILAGFAYEVWGVAITTCIVNIPVSKFPAKNRSAWYTTPIKYELYTHELTEDESKACASFMRDVYCRVTEQRNNARNNLPLLLNLDPKKQCKYCESKSYCHEWNKPRI